MTNRFNEITSEQIINYIFTQQLNYDEIIHLENQAQILRKQNKNRVIKGGFNAEVFYVPQGHKLRNQTIFSILFMAMRVN